MSILNGGSTLGFIGGATPYEISRSLRFNSADSAYLSRNVTSAGNRKTWSASFWIKRSSIGTEQWVFGNYAGYASGGVLIRLQANSTLQFASLVGSTFSLNLETTQVFRDSSAWYHFLFVVDTTQSTASERGRFYVNGQRVTAFSTATYPSQNADLELNRTGNVFISGENAGGNFLNAYIADFHFIDGQALDPTSFGEFSATTGVWMPKRFAGTYGSQGWKLDFSDNSAATATTLGKDSSGNGNNWTPNNLSVTAGAGNDSLIDVPVNGTRTDTGAGGEVRGNYCTLNPLFKGANATLSDGNLQLAITNESGPQACGTIGVPYGSGDFYCEFTQTVAGSNSNMVGLVEQGVSFANNYIGADAKGWGYFGSNGNKYNNGSASSYGSTWGANDVIGIAYKGSTGELFFYKNGVVQNSGTAAFTGLTSGPYFFAAGNGLGGTGVFNFGQRPFAYTAPSGFKALCTANLPAPTIVKPSTVMDVKLYTGNGSTQTISGLEFSPDLVWIKTRSIGYYNVLYDTVRGTGTAKALYSNTAHAEGSDTTLQNLTSFNSDGFSLGATSSTNILNDSSQTRVAWTWDAGSSTVTNNDGTISSQVRANPSAGFSIVTYTGNGVASTIGHGLGVAPSLIIIKSRSSADGWPVYHASVGNTAFLYLNQTSASSTNSAAWNNTSPTSSVFTVGVGTLLNTNGNNHVAYCFAPVAGYSAFGSYTGNGSADGPFVFCGFRPKLVVFKCTTQSATNWNVQDSVRSPANVSDDRLFWSDASAEVTNSAYDMDLLSNGFKFRNTHSETNVSGQTYIWAAFAESPFSLARAR